MSGRRLEEEQTIASKTLLTDSAAAPTDRQTPPGGEDVRLSIRTRKPGGDAENAKANARRSRPHFFGTKSAAVSDNR
jgi:hypothetical protein